MMNRLKPYLCLFFWIAGSALAPSFSELRAQDAALDPNLVGWKSLDFEARKLIFTATSSVRLEVVRTGEAKDDWIDVGEAQTRGTPIRPRGKRVGKIEVSAEAVGSKTTETVWFGLRDGVAAQRLKLKHGSYQKTARFTDQGVFVRRASPAVKKERGEAPEKWSKIEDKFHTRSGGDCPEISHPSTLIYLVSALPENTQSIEVCVFSDKQFLPIEIRRRGTQKIAVDYAATRSGKSSQIKKTIDAEHWTLSPTAAESAKQFELLGMQGAVEIFLEAGDRTPVLLRGRLENLGGVEVKLVAAELHAP